MITRTFRIPPEYDKILNEENFVVSKDNIINYENLIEELNPLSLHSESLKDNIVIGKVKDFGSKLIELSNKHNLEILNKFGSDLVSATSSIDLKLSSS